EGVGGDARREVERDQVARSDGQRGRLANAGPPGRSGGDDHERDEHDREHGTDERGADGDPGEPACIRERKGGHSGIPADGAASGPGASLYSGGGGASGLRKPPGLDRSALLSREVIRRTGQPAAAVTFRCAARAVTVTLASRSIRGPFTGRHPTVRQSSG